MPTSRRATIRLDGLLIMFVGMLAATIAAAAPSALAYEFNAVSPACIPPPSGLVSWWPGDGSATDIADGNTGTLQGSVAFIPGEVGEAFSFDGMSSVTIGNPSNLITNAITLDAWVNLSHDLVEGQLASILTKWAGSPGDSEVPLDAYGIWLLKQSGSIAVIGGIGDNTTRDPGTLIGAPSTSPSWIGEWNHIAMTYDGSTGSNILYVNGMPVATRFRTGGIAATNANVFIGRQDSAVASRFFPGEIDEVEIFNRALTASEIQAIFTAGSAGKCKPCVQPPFGLVGWWPGDGNAKDIHDGNDGTLSGGVSFATGEVGQAFSFDGSTGSVVVPDSNSLDVTTQFTLDAWINPTALQDPTPARQGGVISKVGGPNGNHGYQFGLTGNNTGLFCQFNASGEPWPSNQLIATVAGGIPINTWTHVACTYDNASVTIYVNGVSVGSLLVGAKSVVDSASNLRISADDNGNVFFNGLIDEAEVFNRALTQTEIQSIVNAGSAGKCKATASTTTTTSTTTSSTTTTRVPTTTTSTSTTTTTPSTTSTTRLATTTTTTTHPTSTTTSTSTTTTHAPTTTRPPTTSTSTTSTTTTAPSTTTTVPGNLPPDCTSAAAQPATLWPPNHQFVDVSVVGVRDPDGDPVTITITDIAQDEALNGEGNTCADASGLGNATASLRAEREGGGDGRVYHVGFAGDDGRGGRCTGTVTVCVPHDQGAVCGDQGSLADSTGPTCVGACTGGCAVEMALAKPVCVDENLPATVTQRLDKAQQLISQAATTGSRKKAKNLMRRGIKVARQAVGIAAKAAKKGTISSDCAGSIATEFGNAKSGADRWLRTR